jgi:hypothetical protein
MMETFVSAEVSAIVIVVHQQAQWFPSLLLLFISRHNGFHHCYCCTSADTKVSIIVIVVHQQTQWFYNNNDGNHCVC